MATAKSSTWEIKERLAGRLVEPAFHLMVQNLAIPPDFSTLSHASNAQD